MSQLKGKQVAFLLTVIAVAFPPFTIFTSHYVEDEMRWMFIGSEADQYEMPDGGFLSIPLTVHEKINFLVLSLEVALIWGGYLVFRNRKSAS